MAEPRCGHAGGTEQDARSSVTALCGPEHAAWPRQGDYNGITESGGTGHHRLFKEQVSIFNCLLTEVEFLLGWTNRGFLISRTGLHVGV